YRRLDSTMRGNCIASNQEKLLFKYAAANPASRHPPRIRESQYGIRHIAIEVTYSSLHISRTIVANGRPHRRWRFSGRGSRAARALAIIIEASPANLTIGYQPRAV
ncbi:MAG: hypothetical protein V4793_29140, partial [Paraburkholderia tropica]